MAAEEQTAERPKSNVRDGGAPVRQHHASLRSDRGSTRIANDVVAKIAGLAAREIPGVHSMGKGLARTFGALRARVPGSDGGATTQGVQVEVGERQTAVDLDLVTYYGESIARIAEAVRANVIERIETMTSLQVTEVNIVVDDLYVEGAEGEPHPARVE